MTLVEPSLYRCLFLLHSHVAGDNTLKACPLQVIDNKMIYKIGATLAGVLTTGLPIIFALRPDLDEESAPLDGESFCTTTCDMHMEEKLNWLELKLELNNSRLESKVEYLTDMVTLLMNQTVNQG